MDVFIKNEIKWNHQIHKTYIKSVCKHSHYVKSQETTNIVSEVLERTLERTAHNLFMLRYGKSKRQHKIGATCLLPHHVVNVYSVHPPFCWGGRTSYQIFKKGGLDRILIF